MFQSLWLTAALLAACVTAVPTEPSLGIRLDKRGGLPKVTFPDATYQATNYDLLTDVYTFSNIRFAAPPLGDLRWAKPAPAPKNSTLQDGSYGNACPQAPLVGLNLVGNGSDTPVGTVIDEFLSKIYTPFLSGGAEDCLFLDIYVPGSAVRSPSTTKLPVIHWFYGGGYVLGSKNQLQPLLPFYDGSGLVTESGNNVVFVGSNYRLGAFGFLAGSTMEGSGTPNAGLWDQRAALQWTQDNIALLGGDPDSVTAMGESAGASSLMHHLVAEGGTLDPLFKQAILQSPAFIPTFDRKGSLEQVYQNFSSLAGCVGGDISCLRAADTAALIDANTKLNSAATPGTFLVGPAPDGTLIRQTPSLELASGNYWKSLSSLLVTHTADESTVFVDGSIATDAELDTFLTALFPTYALSSGLDTLLETTYPPTSNASSPYTSEAARLRALVRDSSFTCNVQYLASAYAGRTFAGQYSVSPGWHATDLLPTFWSDGLASSALGTALEVALPFLSAFAAAFKSYLTSFARAGNPNTHRQIFGLPLTVEWPSVGTGSGGLSGVLDMGDFGFSVLDDVDAQVDANKCAFWVQWESALTIRGGYVPPGAVVQTPFIGAGGLGNASVNYGG